MDKDTLNREWAELEGWGFDGIEDGYAKYPYMDGDGAGRNSLPDWTEPNRFFAEVVPRLVKLELNLEFNNFARTNWSASIPVNESLVSGYATNIGEAGLEAAIKARKELGV